VRIRPAVPSDIPALLAIEAAADVLFAGIGMAAVADAGPADWRGELERHLAAGHAWVAVRTDDRPIAYLVLILDLVDGCAHIGQVSVHPGHGRRGIGRSLIEVAASWAAGRDLRAMTLTTFADVPWNAPYYRRLGFREMSGAEIGRELRGMVRQEAAEGLAPSPRVAMIREIRIGVEA
jgi:GNAT superfamily N-acetyltransferase